MLAQKDYKRRHDKACLNLHMTLCRKYSLEVSEKWYQHKVDSVVENKSLKIQWDFNIQTDQEIKHRRPGIVVVNKEKNECTIIDVANPGDHNLAQKKFEKFDNYSELRLKVARMWNKKMVVVLIIIGALGSVPNDLQSYLKQLDIPYDLNTLQHSVQLGTANILRKVLSME